MDHHCCNKQKVKRGLWSPEEDEKLMKHILAHGHGCWSYVPKLAGLQRCGKSCRLRWINYLRPDVKRGSFTVQEERIILDVHRILGNRWAQIAKHLPGRTDNEVKNFWNSCIKKKLISQGLDPNTHNLLPSASRVNASSNNNNTTNNNNVTPITTINLFTVSPSSKSNSMNNISPSLVTMPIYSNIGLHDTMAPTTFQYQDPQNTMQHAICSSPSSSWENMSASLPFDNSEFMDEACLWGGSINEVDDAKFQRNEQTYEIYEGAEMDVPTYNNSAFDIELIDSMLKPCGLFINENSLEQLQWECELGH